MQLSGAFQGPTITALLDGRRPGGREQAHVNMRVSGVGGGGGGFFFLFFFFVFFLGRSKSGPNLTTFVFVSFRRMKGNPRSVTASILRARFPTYEEKRSRPCSQVRGNRVPYRRRRHLVACCQDR